MRRHASDIVFGLLIAAAVGVALLAALVWTGHFVGDGGSPAPATHRGPPTKVRPRPARRAPVRAAKTPPAQPVAQTTVPRVSIYASRGDCWVAAHKGSASGPVLIERVLSEGETITLRGRQIWLQLGAAGNVDVTVDGKNRQIPSGTTSVELG